MHYCVGCFINAELKVGLLCIDFCNPMHVENIGDEIKPRECV